ncbi:hypothetical protein HanIR_Chr09g0416611 [Helianthus annuus]|nr:hypothetical protein HanIR_Chr09g0416611 [Helianthus annuus]
MVSNPGLSCTSEFGDSSDKVANKAGSDTRLKGKYKVIARTS